MEGGNIAQVTVFNPHSWPRKEWVEIAISLPRGAAEHVRVLQGSQPVPAALLWADRYSDGSVQEARMAIGADLPALGFLSYSLAPAKEVQPRRAPSIEMDKTNLCIITPYLEVRFNPEGGIASMVARGAAVRFLNSGKRSAFFAGKINGQDCESKGTWALEAAGGGAPWAVARESGVIGSIPYTLEMIFREDMPRLDCRATFHFDGQKIGRLSENKRDSYSPFLHEEKLRFKLFPAVEEAAVGVRDLPFAIAETSDKYVEGNYWTALTDNSVGIAVFNRGTMGSVREADGGFSTPLAYAMYYVWGTRMLSGDYTYEFAIYPFTGRWTQADLHRRALEYGFPCTGICSAPGDGRLGNEVRLLDVPSSDVLLSALYSDKGGVVARMYEHRGSPTRTSVKYLMGPARMTEVDLSGRKVGPTSRSLTFQPWQIRTIRIEPLK